MKSRIVSRQDAPPTEVLQSFLWEWPPATIDFAFEIGRLQEAWSIGKDISHMPAASLGHNAALSFVVIGRSEIINFGY